MASRARLPRNVRSAHGEGRTVKIQHAATNEANAWVDLPDIEWLVDDDATGGLASTDTFLRYIRWSTDASVDGDPVVTIDVVAKE